MYKLASAEQTRELDDLTETWELSRVLQLNTESPLIIIAGAYQGKLCQWFLEKYPTAQVVGYEPAKWAYERATQRLNPYAMTHEWEIRPYALGMKSVDGWPMFEWETDAQTFLDTPDKLMNPRDPTLEAEAVGNIREAVYELRTLVEEYHQSIDLFVMNMEGYEYYLLPHLLQHPEIHDEYGNLSHLVKSLAVQFHTQYEPSVSIYASILHTLDNTYPRHFNYFLPSWGYWYGDAK